MQLDQLWSKTCAIFSAEISGDVVDTWLSQVRLVGFDGNTATMTGSERARGWIELRYLRPLAQCIGQAAGCEVEVELVPEDEAASITTGQPGKADKGIAFSPLNPKYTFSQFVIGKSNHIAHAATLAVAEQPAQAFNPLFLYGSPGVGKTHLLHSIGNYLTEQAPELTARYMTAEDFASLFRAVLRDGSIGEFKQELRSTDVLLIDDIQFLQSKAKTEEEFFHTFNTLQESGRQLVISCDRTPRELDQLAARMRERFESGLVVEVEPPESRLRQAILGKRVQVDNIPIDDELVLQRIAESVPPNVRSLEGALIRVSAFSSMRGEPVTSKLVDELLGSLHPESNSQAGGDIVENLKRSNSAVARSSDNWTRPRVDAIVEHVAEHFSLTRDDLVGKGRTRLVSGPRQIAMYLSCKLTDDTLPQIASVFNRDHSTVVHARDKVSRLVREDTTTSTALDSLEQEIVSSVNNDLLSRQVGAVDSVDQSTLKTEPSLTPSTLGQRAEPHA